MVVENSWLWKWGCPIIRFSWECVCVRVPSGALGSSSVAVFPLPNGAGRGEGGGNGSWGCSIRIRVMLWWNRKGKEKRSMLSKVFDQTPLSETEQWASILEYMYLFINDLYLWSLSIIKEHYNLHVFLFFQIKDKQTWLSLWRSLG